MEISLQFIILVFFTKCVAVNIRNLHVPPLVETGSGALVLDCDYSVGTVSRNSGLVVKWFFNERNLVYQWIPPLRPQVIGILKDKIDKTFKISEEPLQMHRAIKIIKPSIDLSGNYTCVVSTFMEEDRRTKHMLVYSTGNRFEFVQQKKYVFLVTLICVAQQLYPKPEMFIISQGKPLPQAVSEIKMDSWGLYTINTTVVVHDSDIIGLFEQFECELRLPPANYTATRSTVYVAGLMPTPQTALVEVIAVKAQERQANDSGVLRIAWTFTTFSAITWFIIS